jgi:hypothetical protein
MVKIYPFEKLNELIILRPTDCIWNPKTHRFVYVLPSRLADKEHLLFIKCFWNSTTKKQLVYHGTISVSDTTTILDRLKHIKRICGADSFSNVQILKILSSIHFMVVDISKTVKENELHTGSVLVIQQKLKEITPNILASGLVYKPYGKHSFRLPKLENPVLKALFQQVLRGEWTDVILSGPRNGTNTFQFTVHKNMITMIPYFQSLFTSGMSESCGDDHVVKLELQIDVEEVVVREFLYFLYLRDRSRIDKLSPLLLLSLLRLADYYCFDELLESVVKSLGKRYYSLTGETALQVLTTIQHLQFQNKKSLEEMALAYFAFNFAEVGKMKAFRELAVDDHEIYDNVIDYVARATYEAIASHEEQPQ